MKQSRVNSFKLEQVEKRNIFSTPENYFPSLTKNIAGRLVEISDLNRATLFQVPDQYFERLTENINRRITKETSTLSSNLKGNIFGVPDGYFAAFQNELDAKIGIPQAPILNEKIQNVHELPNSYFEVLSEKIHKRIEDEDNLIKVDFVSDSVIRYAVAASVALILVTSVAFYFMNQTKQNELSKREEEQYGMASMFIASLDKKEIRSYLEKQDRFDTHELTEFLSEDKKQKINADFENELLFFDLKDQDKDQIEMELNELDISELQSDI